MKNRNKIIISLSFVALLVLAGCAQKPEPIKLDARKPAPAEEPKQEPGDIVGGDRDENGCIGSAGYSWCEPKNKCLRVWEETCYASTAQEIQYILAKKYNRPVAEVKITISKEDANFAGGSVLFGQGGPGEGGMFLARKAGNVWEVVFDGNGNVDCQKMRQDYQFPDSILVPNFCQKI